MPVWGILVRRWYLVLGALVVSAALAIVGFYVSKPTYEARADMLLLPPARTSGPTGGLGNPYLALERLARRRGAGRSRGGGVRPVRRALAEQGRRGRCTASGSTRASPRRSSSIVTRDTSADEATQTLNAVMSEYNRTLLTVQQDAGAPARAIVDDPGDHYDADPTAAAEDADPKRDSGRRRGAAAGPVADPASRTTGRRAHEAQAGPTERHRTGG